MKDSESRSSDEPLRHHELQSIACVIAAEAERLGELAADPFTKRRLAEIAAYAEHECDEQAAA